MKTEINYYTKLSKQFLRKDLIYQIYDSYYLDNKQNFYIFELEYPEESFFSQLNNYQDQPVFKSAIEKLKEFFSEQFLDLGDYFPIFCINNLKINLFDLCKYQKYFFNKITNISKKQRYKVKEQFDLQALNQIPICLHFTQFQEFQPKQKQQITNQGQIMLVEYDNNQQEQENENLQDDISQDSVEDELQLQLQLDEEFNQEQYILNQINSFKNAIFLKIKKENLLEKIKEFYSDILQYHSEQLFLLIQQHPKYDYFQVLSYDIDYVELKILQNKTWKTLLIKKFNCFQKAQDEENLINLQANIIQNAINTEIIVLEKHFYLLTEYKYFRNQFQKYPSLEDLLTIFRGQSKNKLFIYQLLVEINHCFWMLRKLLKGIKI
ncbi:hypothetical protein TTHERM_00873650 (macronuclear) [Tetrahymena thermophila SB210]|uniref:Uncharacterized protein n=1 Tax=Tetrahymena thermophila (strain SB210) TaxID=312017 RepID=Q22LJ1_TETTS|nr:hypothetical protein TTHERM_00873650 [Tetrahymena thermophila SB210]EAR86149.2 hypothetical protein TTHERM_00873650 [Tetrahymena thermophila SB210]|eukprot:XP_976744.2 hypothetical protein TTHERM_00873650 [Tetrahymena thermophila SB210]